MNYGETKAIAAATRIRTPSITASTHKIQNQLQVNSVAVLQGDANTSRLSGMNVAIKLSACFTRQL